MATVEQCEQALRTLAQRLADNDPSRRRAGFDRSLTCTIRDLDVVFSGRLSDGQLVDIGRATTNATGNAQVRLTMTSDDLLALVDGQLKMASAWATGRVKVDAGVRDLMRLRSIF
ncbi:MAG: alkyl sulfatase C-terminal domain-containing protein [Jatrophihabitans sp.]|uniref:alkyl sulfatase C-terminal domain-containing protein n=1 Tax=Jatrophihabitans sp. TaxID=1932789 RepID=UPI00390CFDA4